jgi:hypothetical protein
MRHRRRVLRAFDDEPIELVPGLQRGVLNDGVDGEHRRKLRRWSLLHDRRDLLGGGCMHRRRGA